MRKLTLILILVMLAISNIFSQTRPSVFVKWAPASLAVGKVTVGSEINFTRKSSIDVMIGIPSAKTHTIEYDDKESDIESKALSALIGYRYYLGKRSARGVYLEPYAKYLRHEAAGVLEGDLGDRSTKMDTRTKYEAFGLGAQMGVQFMLFKRVSFDFYFLGFEANSAKVQIRAKDIANSIPWTFDQAEEAQWDIEDAIEDIPYLKDKVNVSVNRANKSMDTDFKGFLPGLRFGASIGFRF